MNDRFKFRYYYITEKRYLKNSEIQAIAVMSMIEQKANDSVEVEQALCAEINGEIITEQCTGLQDKNGRLIYEGDICLLYGRKYEIRWKVTGLGARDYPPCADSDGYIFSDTVPFTNRLYLREDLKEIEVVGTIHDNPDNGWPITPQGKSLPKGTKTWER